MKTDNILKVVACAAMGLAFAACANVDEYTPAPQEDASKTYVRVDDTAPRSLDVDGADIIVPLIRTNTTGTMDVTVALQDTSGLFKLNSTTVSFASGETTANASVSYSYDALDPEAVYSIEVAITSEGVTSEYSPVALPMSCKKAWQNLGMAQWYDDWWIGGPFEKLLLKAPDGTETYKLIDPWDKENVEAGGFGYTNALDLVFFVAEDGTITYDDITLGFTYSGMTCHMWHPATMGDDASVSENAMIAENVAQFCWYPVLNNGGSWWGVSSYAWISFPGGPDLSEMLGL